MNEMPTHLQQKVRGVAGDEIQPLSLLLTPGQCSPNHTVPPHWPLFIEQLLCARCHLRCTDRVVSGTTSCSHRACTLDTKETSYKARQGYVT